jgi:hypothetical protein
MSDKGYSSWQDDPKRMIAFQLSKIKAWDSLVGNRLRVNCVTDDTLTLTYIIIFDGNEIAKRRKPKSTADYIVDNHLQEKMTIVEDGAVALIPSLSPGNCLIQRGDYPAFNKRGFSMTTDRFSVTNSSKTGLISRAVNLLYYEIIRIVVPFSRRT